MTLLEEAIFNKEEVEFIMMLMTNACQEAEKLKIELMKATLRDDMMMKMLSELAERNEDAKRAKDKYIEGLAENVAKDIDRKARIASAILTKMHLYNNCVLNKD